MHENKDPPQYFTALINSLLKLVRTLGSAGRECKYLEGLIRKLAVKNSTK